VRSSLRFLIRSVGLQSQVFDSAVNFLKSYDPRQPGCLLLDVRMPGMSGIETLRRVRQKHPDLPVLLVTAFADIRSAVAAMRDGAVNYLAKPIDLDELIATVRRATHTSAPLVAPREAERRCRRA
jgi:FixJ family two-component response regulator